MTRPGPLLDHYLRQMADSIVKVEKSERVYNGVVAGYQDRFGESVIADYRAADDVRLRQAIGDGAFYRSRAQMYSSAAIALMLHEQYYPQGGGP